MNAVPDLSGMFWQVAVTGPVYLALLVAGVGLLYRRRAAPRACTVAAVAILSVFVAHVGLDAVRGWLVTEREAAVPVTSISVPVLEFARLASLVLNSLVIAVAILAVAWAVVLALPPGPVLQGGDVPGHRQGVPQELVRLGEIQVVDHVDQQQGHVGLVRGVAVQVVVLGWHHSAPR